MIQRRNTRSDKSQLHNCAKKPIVTLTQIYEPVATVSAGPYPRRKAETLQSGRDNTVVTSYTPTAEVDLGILGADNETTQPHR